MELDFVMSYWNSHRIRLQRDVELTTGVAPDVLYYQPELFSAEDCSLPLQCSVEQLSELYREFSQTDPARGCSDSFLARISLLSGIPQQSLEIADTSEDALKMYVATKDLLKTVDHDT